MRGFWLGQWNEREGRSEVSPRTLRLTHLQARLAMYATLGAMAAGGTCWPRLTGSLPWRITGETL